MSNDIQAKLANAMVGGLMSGSIALGKKLGLFEALHATGSESCPATAAQVAEAAACKERYVREWLSGLGCGGFIEMTSDEKFYLTPQQYQEYEGLNSRSVTMMGFLPSFMRTYNELADAFKLDGRLGLKYAQFGDFYEKMNAFTQAMHGKHLISDYMPQIGWDAALRKGGVTVMDVGCGSGWHVLTLAAAYPNTHFIGCDISEYAIGVAKDSLKETALTNVEFFVHDAGHMPSEWSNRFDYITIFDACHDQQRPDLCLNEIYRMLKPNGVFAMLEVNGTSNAHKDKESNGMTSAAFYAISMFHCLPVGSDHKDALCMGAMWGERRALELIHRAGFNKDNVNITRPPYFPLNIVYICKKD